MIQSGNTVIMTFEELDLFGQRVVLKTIEQLKLDQTIPNVSVKVGIPFLMEHWGVKSRTTIWKWARRKVKPLPLGTDKKIELKEAERWWKEDKDTYQY